MSKENPYLGMKCHQCGKKYRGRGEWNVELQRGEVQWIVCPGCQTPEQNAEADINDSTTDYYRDSFGRIVGTSKVEGFGD